MISEYMDAVVLTHSYVKTYPDIVLGLIGLPVVIYCYNLRYV